MEEVNDFDLSRVSSKPRRKAQSGYGRLMVWAVVLLVVYCGFRVYSAPHYDALLWEMERSSYLDKQWADMQLDRTKEAIRQLRRR